MKKLFHKIKNHFKCKDLDKYDNLPVDEQYYRLRIHQIKSNEKFSRWANFFIILGAFLISLSFMIAAINIASDPSFELSASAAEETVADMPYIGTGQWYNYTMHVNVLTLPFLSFDEDFLNDPFSFYGGNTEYGMFLPYSIRLQDTNSNVLYEGSVIFYDYHDGVDPLYYPRYDNVISSISVDFSSYVSTGEIFTFYNGVSYPWYYFDLLNVIYGFDIAFSSDYYVDVNSLVLSVTPTFLDYQFANDEAQSPINRPWYRLSLGSSSSAFNSGFWYFDENAYLISNEPYYSVVSNTGTAYNDGYWIGYDKGFEKGSDHGFAQGSQDGFDRGFKAGVDRGKIEGATNANDYSFLSLVSAVFDAPIKVIIGDMVDTNNDGIVDTRVGGLLNFDLLGVNVSSFLLAIFTVCLIVALVKLIISR